MHSTKYISTVIPNFKICHITTNNSFFNFHNKHTVFSFLFSDSPAPGDQSSKFIHTLEFDTSRQGV